MAASGSATRKASHHIPWADNQGLDYLAGAGTKGGCIQGAVFIMTADGKVAFKTLGLTPMATSSYVVIATNSSGTAAPKVARDATRTTSGFTVTGPAVGDAVEFLVYGPLAGVLYK